MSAESDTINSTNIVSDGHEEIDGESLIVIFFITALVVSLLCRTINQKFGIPYTPQLLLCGFLVGVFEVWGHITQGVEIIKEINPHAILMIFLPLLIMESSFNAHTNILSVNYVQVLTLIVPAVIITALLLAVCVKSIIGYEDDSIDWWGALVLGSILAATDPVAVVALLKELGAPLHISTLIEMESLFNDGTAMVFFSIFYASFKGQSQTVADGIVMFFRLSFGGIGLGIAFGLGVILILQFLKKGMTLFLHILILSSYSVFFVAETLIEVSGILAIVGCGLVMNRFMKNQMTVSQVHSAETVLTYLSHIIETILFLFAGIIIGVHWNSSFGALSGSDWGYLFALYLLVVVVRAISVFVLSPILYYTGEGFNTKEMILTIWGALRGALGIALALVVYATELEDGNENQDNENKKSRAQILILFFVCGIAALTLLANGVTAPYVVMEIKLIQNISVRQYFKSLFLKSVKKVGQQKFENLKYDQSFSMTAWHGVEDIVQFDQIDDERKHINVFKNNIIFKFREKQKLQVSQHRYQILRHMMKFLSDLEHDSYYFNNIMRKIEDALMECCEKSHHQIEILNRCKRTMSDYSIVMKLMRLPIIGKLFEVYFNYELEKNFKLLDILHYILVHTIEMELQYQKRMPNDFGLIDELHAEVLLVNEELMHYRKGFSDEIQKLSQQQAALKVLKKQAHFVDSKIGGLVAEKEGTSLRNEILDSLWATRSPFVTMKLQGGKDLILHTTFQGLLEEQEIMFMCQHQQIDHFGPNREIVTREDPHMYVILSGEVEERIYKNESEFVTLQYGNNNVVGLANSIDKNLQISIHTLSDVEALKVDISPDINPEFKKYCYRKSLPCYLKLYGEDPKIQQMTTIQLVHIGLHSEILLNASSCVPEFGGLIYHGTFVRVDTNQQYHGPCIIEPMNIMLKPSGEYSAIALFKVNLTRQVASRKFTYDPQNVQMMRKKSVMDKLLQ